MFIGPHEATFPQPAVYCGPQFSTPIQQTLPPHRGLLTNFYFFSLFPEIGTFRHLDYLLLSASTRISHLCTGDRLRYYRSVSDVEDIRIWAIDFQFSGIRDIGKTEVRRARLVDLTVPLSVPTRHTHTHTRSYQHDA